MVLSFTFLVSDLATMDEDGNIQIIDRSKKIATGGGENIIPAQVGAILQNNSEIEHLQVCVYA